MSTISPPRPRLDPEPNTLPTPLARLEQSRDQVAKAWLVHAVDRTPLDQIASLPVALAATELPALVSDLCRAAAGGNLPGSLERADWLDRLDELRGARPGESGPIARDLGVLQRGMLTALREHAAEFPGGDLMAAAADLAELFAELQADAAERQTRGAEAGPGLGELLGGADRLTGLRAQGFGREHLSHLVWMHKRYGQPFALLLVDIEGLKRINDAYGSAAGDQTLVGVAGAVERAVRNVDTAVRMDEDEFCVLLPNQTASRARIAADRLAASVEQVADPSGNPLRISIGVVACPQHAASTEDLLAVADGALYRAKAAGERVAVGPEAPDLPDLPDPPDAS